MTSIVKDYTSEKIKEGLEERYKNRIRHYEETQTEHYNNSRISQFEIRQLERLLYDFFGIDNHYNSDLEGRKQ